MTSQSSIEDQFSRRHFLVGSAAVAAGAWGLTACSTSTPATAKAFSIYAAHYTPSDSMTKSDANPTPHHNLKVVIEEYARNHGGANITAVKAATGPQTDERTWAVTQFTSNRAPAIMNTQSSYAQQDIGKHWWHPLDDFLNKPNPYVAKGAPGSEKWLDSFYSAPMAVKQATDGHFYVVPLDLVTTQFFYNQNAFTRAGVQPPTNFSEFIEVGKALKGAGYTPMSGFSFAKTQLGDMVVKPWKAQIKATGPGGAYTVKDVTQAIIEGTFNADSEEYKSYLRLLQQIEPYWTRDWAVQGIDFSQKFTQGKLAILEDGTWRFALLDAVGSLPFEWSTFTMPSVSQGTGEGQAPSADGSPAPSIGGATGAQLGVTNSVKDEDLEGVVDFLRYLTAPQQIGRVVNELGQYVPAVQGAPINQRLRGPLDAVKNGVGEAGMIFYFDKITFDAQLALQNLTTEFLQGKHSIDETATKSQKIYKDQAVATVKKNGW